MWAKLDMRILQRLALNYVLESPFLMQTSLVSGWILVRHGSCIFQLICLWTAHNRPCGSRSLPPLVTSSVLMGSKGFSNCTRMSTIQSRRPGNKAENHVTLTQKFLWKPCFTTLLPFLSSNPKIVKAFPKTLPTKMKPSKCPAREKKKGKKSERRGKERKWKEKVKTALSLLNSKTISKFFFLWMPEHFTSWYFACVS